MEIPTAFTLMGTRWVVEYDDLERAEADGMCEFHKHKIILDYRLLRKNKEDALRHTFLHELTHAILFHLNEDILNANEQFVDTFSGLLHQALTTGEKRTHVNR